MGRRVGYFVIGALCIVQAHALLGDEVSFSTFLSSMILQPSQFLVISFLFLLSFLMFSGFFYRLIQLSYLQVSKQTKIRGKDVLETTTFAVLFVCIFWYSFWLSALASLFAIGFSLTAFLPHKKRGKDSDGKRGR